MATQPSSTPSPIHLLASFADRDEFFQHYMYHVPSGGVFVELHEGTALPLLSRDARELVGQIAEVRIKIARPNLELDFRGAITYATPFMLGQNFRRLSVEFFAYETAQKNFLLDILSEDLEAMVNHQVAFRKHRRFPAHLRVQFEQRLGQSGLRVVGRMEEISRGGCSFRTVRFLTPGEIIPLTLYWNEPTLSQKPAALQLAGKVRWSDPTNFARRQMGLEFDFGDARTQNAEPFLRRMIEDLQTRCEADLLRRRLVRTIPSI